MLSEMTVEVHRLGNRQIIGFNGTTEWALDSVDDSDAVWLPRETQLRELLGATFRGLRRQGTDWQVDLEIASELATFADPDTEEAYAQALLHLVSRSS